MGGAGSLDVALRSLTDRTKMLQQLVNEQEKELDKLRASCVASALDLEQRQQPNLSEGTKDESFGSTVRGNDGAAAKLPNVSEGTKEVSSGSAVKRSSVA